MKSIQIFLLSLIVISILSCENNKEMEEIISIIPEDTEISFVNDVQPILTNRCAGCHGNSGGVSVDGYDNVKKAASKASFLGAIKHENGFKAMPQGATNPIPQPEIQTIEKWITDGQKNN